MAYDDTHCPCGGFKFHETMLCQECETAFAETNEMKCFRDSINFALETRRGAAIRLLAMSRRRVRRAGGAK
jgi:hypothetical protein